MGSQVADYRWHKGKKFQGKDIDETYRTVASVYSLLGSIS
jgi:hypothetical protein